MPPTRVLKDFNSFWDHSCNLLYSVIFFHTRFGGYHYHMCDFIQQVISLYIQQYPCCSCMLPSADVSVLHKWITDYIWNCWAKSLVRDDYTFHLKLKGLENGVNLNSQFNIMKIFILTNLTLIPIMIGFFSIYKLFNLFVRLHYPNIWNVKYEVFSWAKSLFLLIHAQYRTFRVVLLLTKTKRISLSTGQSCGQWDHHIFCK